MIGRKHGALAATYVLLDAAGSGLSLLLAWFFRFVVEVVPVTRGVQDIGVYLRILPVVCVVFPVVFAIQGLYRVRPGTNRAEELVGVTIGTLLGTLILSGLLLWIRPGDQVMYSRATLAMFVVCELLVLVIGRTLVRAAVERGFHAGRGLDRVLIVGSGELAQSVADRISAHREFGLSIVGYASSDASREIDGLERLGSLSDVVDIVRGESIDHVFVALPSDRFEEMMHLLDRLVREYVTTHVVPDLLQFMALRSRVEDLDGLATINLSDTPLDGWNRVMKRTFDVISSTVGLIVAGPFLAIVAAIIKLDDGGPVFYRQTRMGLDGLPFEIVKFRSMRVDAERDTGAVWASADDPRRTSIGRWLRSWSLDELPQLWNVWRGEMSLVGPRPERPQFVEQFRSEYRHYMLRHKVRAGVTGWAQVHGWRGNTSMRMRIEHDLYYIENWSMLLDLKIILMTLRRGFRNENAY